MTFKIGSTVYRQRFGKFVTLLVATVQLSVPDVNSVCVMLCVSAHLPRLLDTCVTRRANTNKQTHDRVVMSLNVSHAHSFVVMSTSSTTCWLSSAYKKLEGATDCLTAVRPYLYVLYKMH